MTSALSPQSRAAQSVSQPASPSTVLARENAIAVGAEQSWTLPELPANRRVSLRITARRQTPKLGGYGYYVQYAFNGKPLDASINRFTPRLQNKALSFKRPDGNEIFWNLGDGVWHTFFVPDFTTDPSQYGPKLIDEPYTIVLDVSDLITPGGQNSFSARNLISPGSGKEIPIVLSVELLQGETLASQPTPPAPPVLEGKPEIELQPGGGFTLVFGKTRLPFESRFSYPHGTFNHLAQTASQENQPHWKPESRQTAPNRWEMSASGEHYRLDRVIELHQQRVSVTDRYTNLTPDPLAIRLSHHLNFGEEPLLSCRIGGQGSESLNNVYCPANPTLFLPLKESSLGIVVEDDVLRNQSILFYDTRTRTTGMNNDLFSLRGNASQTTHWSVYFQPSADYFDFINLVRNDWGANITLKGPVYFDNYHRLANMTDEDAAKLLAIRQPEYLVFWEVRKRTPSPEWGDRIIMANGPGILDASMADEIALLRKAIDRVRRVAPEVKLSLYTHSFFVSPEKPEDPRFSDSWIVDLQGNRKQSVYNSPHRVDFQTVYPTLENSYGKEYLKLIDFYLNDLGFDWLYWDESVGPGVTNSDVVAGSQQDRYATYDIWDGHTAQIHRRKKIIEKPFAMLPLITRPLFAEIIRKVEAKGGFVLFNSAATTQQRQGSPSFVESQDTLTRGYEAHLNTPLAYGYGQPTMADLRARLKLGLIYARTHLEYPSAVVSRCYPFTPIELHAGWVKGKERIITSLSGDFGWEDKASAARLVLFDKTGNLASEATAEFTPGGKVAITVPEGGIAILERMEDPAPSAP